MKTIYFIRHGQTKWNVANKICGATDIELTDLGRDQARQTGKLIASRIREGKMHIDMILTSPLSRAFDTASLIAEETGIDFRAEERLREQNFGKYESTPRDGKEFALQKENFIYSFDGGESMLKVAHRIYDLLDELATDDKIYLLVAHNGIARMINSYFHDMTNKEFARYGIDNCEISEYHYGQ